MKLWFDINSPAPEGYMWAKTITQARVCILDAELRGEGVEILDIGDDEMDERSINAHGSSRLLEWLEAEGDQMNYNIHLHGKNDYNLNKLRTIISRNGWKEV